MNIQSIKPTQDNVLVRLRLHELAKDEEVTAGGIVLPKARNEVARNQAIEATVVAAGPGHYSDTWAGQEKGSNPAGDGFWVPMDESIKPGAKVLIEGGEKVGQRVWSDEREEYRMIRESEIAMVVE